MNSYEIDEFGRVTPYFSGRKSNSDSDYRDATELELHQKQEIEYLTKELAESERQTAAQLGRVKARDDRLEKLQAENESQRVEIVEQQKIIEYLWGQYWGEGPIDWAHLKQCATTKGAELCGECEYPVGSGTPGCHTCLTAPEQHSYEMDSEQRQVLHRSLRAGVTPVKGLCEWHEPDDETDEWQTACGVSWSFTYDGVEENGMKFCHNCGRRISVVRNETESEKVTK